MVKKLHATNKTIVSFDIDGVVADTASLAIKIFNKRFKQNKKITDLKRFFIIKEWLLEILNNEEHAINESIKIWNDPYVQSKAKPVKGSLDVINKLHKENYNVHFITSRPNFSKEITIDWFKRWFPWVQKDSIHIASGSSGQQRLGKLELIKSVAPHVHFDDAVEHIVDISSSMPNTKVVMVRQPWNYNITDITLPSTVLVPVGRNAKRNLMASFELYINSN